MWIRQGIKARRTRNEGRVRALKAMREERQLKPYRGENEIVYYSQNYYSDQIIY